MTSPRLCEGRPSACKCGLFIYGRRAACCEGGRSAGREGLCPCGFSLHFSAYWGTAGIQYIWLKTHAFSFSALTIVHVDPGPSLSGLLLVHFKRFR